MRSKNTPVISAILKRSNESLLTYEWARKQLKGFSHEVILAPDWKTGYEMAKGDFICFLEDDCVLSDNYFKKLFSVFGKNTLYRKLSMVCPAVGLNSWESRSYGYLLSPSSVLPSFVRSSGSFYMIQIAYIPGSIIRRSAMGNKLIDINDENLLFDSANLSIFLWSNGGRIGIEPQVTYVSTNPDAGKGISYRSADQEAVDPIVAMWKREMIA